MTIGELVTMLKDLPPDLNIYVENEGEAYSNMKLEPITTSCDDSTVIAYVLTQEKTISFDDYMKGIKG